MKRKFEENMLGQTFLGHTLRIGYPPGLGQVVLRTDLDWHKEGHRGYLSNCGWYPDVPSSGLAHVSLWQTVLSAKWSCTGRATLPWSDNLVFPEVASKGGVGDLISRTR